MIPGTGERRRAGIFRTLQGLGPSVFVCLWEQLAQKGETPPGDVLFSSRLWKHDFTHRSASSTQLPLLVVSCCCFVLLVVACCCAVSVVFVVFAISSKVKN